jgi:hypothetical protein
MGQAKAVVDQDSAPNMMGSMPPPSGLSDLGGLPSLGGGKKFGGLGGVYGRGGAFDVDETFLKKAKTGIANLKKIEEPDFG